MVLDISKLTFEERVYSEFFDTTFLYFIAPRELISDKYPEAESARIRIEVDNYDPYGPYYEIMISPTKDGIDYDWRCLYTREQDTVRKLIDIGFNQGKENNSDGDEN